MGQYQNFTFDFPERIAQLDKHFRPIAADADLTVSYTLMKMAASFLLPYERIEGESAARSDIPDSCAIRKYLELDKRFNESSYCSTINDWASIDVDDFCCGPRNWHGNESRLRTPVHKVLKTFRHSLAHSNLFFDGETEIERLYLGSRKERNRETGKYDVIRCTVHGLDNIVDAWIVKLQSLRASSSRIWGEIKKAA